MQRQLLCSRRDEAGSAMVEMVIILPILALLLFATIEFGIAMQRWQVISNAAREAVRANVVAACTPGGVADAAAQAIVDNYVTVAGMTPGQVTMDQPINLCGTTGTFATVVVRHNFPLPVVGGFIPSLGGGIPLRGASTMRNE